MSKKSNAECNRIFCERVRRFIRISGKTIIEVANDVNIPYSTFSGYLNERRTPDFETVKRIADYFGVIPEYLIGWSNTSKPHDRAIEITDIGDFGAILNCAVRYSLGRQTYMPKLVIDFITPILSKLDTRTLNVFINDLSNPHTDFGSDKIDKPEWLKFLKNVETEYLTRT